MSEITAHRVEGDDIEQLKSAGDFRWTAIQDGKPGRMMFVCPCGCGSIAGVTIKPVAANGWNWNGDFDKPTLQPSIAINQNHWHGFLTDGVFRQC